MSNAAELIGVGKRYGCQHVLRDVSMPVRRAEIVCLVGPNGAGKTTLVKILATLLSPTSGTVLIDGVDAAADPMRARRGLAIVPQGVTPDPYTTAYEHVACYLRARGLPKYEARERAYSALRGLDLWDHRDVPARKLSGGFQRRIILAMALATEPRLLLLDEPSTALDPAARRQVWERLVDVRPQTSILVTTHDMAEAQMLGDRVALLADGMIIGADTVSSLLSRLPSDDKFVIDGFVAGDLDLERYGSPTIVAGRTVLYPRDAKAAAALADVLMASGASFSRRSTDLEDCYFRLLDSAEPAHRPADAAPAFSRSLQ